MFTKDFSELSLKDLSIAGGKNASLGEMISTLNPYGIEVPPGFAVLVAGYQLFLQENGLQEKLAMTLQQLDTKELSNLAEIGQTCRAMLAEAKLPPVLENEVKTAIKNFRVSDPCPWR